MLINLTPLETITYRAALAFQFTDAVTGKAVSDGLRVRAWAFDPADPRPARRVDEAEKSPHSGVYGFRSLRGLSGYQIGETIPAASLSFIVHIEDDGGRFLPQTRRYDLPLPNPAVQAVPLISGPDRPAPSGFGLIRAQLVRTSAPTGGPPEITVIEPAAWARLAISVPGDNPGDPANLFHGLADGRGTALALVPYPIIPSSTLLDEAEWTVTVSVEHEPAALRSDFDLLAHIVPDLDRETMAPLQSTLTSQATATLFGAINVVSLADQTYTIVGPPNASELDFTLAFGRPLTLRTANAGAPDDPLSELLLESA